MVKNNILALAATLFAVCVFINWPPTAVQAATAGAVTYSYDSLGRITQEVYPANSAVFAYDNAGNRSLMTQN